MSNNQNEKPNYATVTLAQSALPAGHYRSGKSDEVVQGFVDSYVDHGALVFKMADGSMVAYGAGHWARVETTYNEDCVA